MKIITDAGIEIAESQIDTEYAKTIINAMLSSIVNDCVYKEDALKELDRVQNYLDKFRAKAEMFSSISEPI
jgi:hypothetical protein